MASKSVNKQFILSCAHNFGVVEEDIGNGKRSFAYFLNGKFHFRKNGEKHDCATLLEKVHIYPKYLDSIQNACSDSGYDIAIAVCAEDMSGSIFQKNIRLGSVNEAEAGDKIALVG